MAEHEGNAVLVAQVGEPVPGEHAFDGDCQTVTIRRHGVKERARVGGIVLVQDGVARHVEDAQVHAPGMQIHTAVESVRLLIERLFVEAHPGLLAMGVGV